MKSEINLALLASAMTLAGVALADTADGSDLPDWMSLCRTFKVLWRAS